ncbi:MAG: hypothetical protein JSS69_04985 [Acidobacteria bacterium]|nr:hypothetical protein [Acidobacteriota bacterium]MBS1865254.1 hypothetical protein [Acidobacteriota bacterium]
MSDKVRCTCRRCSIRSLMGPAVITTLGILFLLSQFRGGYLAFHHTFPVILIVIGAILLASSIAPTDGHISSSAMPSPPAPPVSPYQGPAQPPASGQGQ